MRIAFLNTYCNGSTGRIISSLKQVCQSNGIEVLSIFSRGNVPNLDDKSIRYFNKVEFYLDGLFTRLFDNHGRNNHYNTQRIISLLADFKPDIIHIHNLHGYWINYKMLFEYIKENNIKVIWTFHDCWNFTGHCTHFDFIGCDKWKKGCSHCKQLKEYPACCGPDRTKKNYFEKKQAFTSIEKAIIVTPSHWLKTKVEESFLSSYQIEVINNGIDTSIFKPMPDAELRDKIFKKGYTKIVLGVAATWNERKGLKDIIAIANKEPHWFFVAIGDIPDKIEPITLNNNVLFIKRTENVYELVKWYSSADVFVNPTLEDTYPTTNLESIACGTPVITYPTGGSVEIIEHFGYGLITEEKSSESLNNSIHALFKSPFLHRKYDYSLNAEDKFTEYLSLYNRLYSF